MSKKNYEEKDNQYEDEEGEEEESEQDNTKISKTSTKPQKMFSDSGTSPISNTNTDTKKITNLKKTQQTKTIITTIKYIPVQKIRTKNSKSKRKPKQTKTKI